VLIPNVLSFENGVYASASYPGGGWIGLGVVGVLRWLGRSRGCQCIYVEFRIFFFFEELTF
jgi:hypothetical protein